MSLSANPTDKQALENAYEDLLKVTAILAAMTPLKDAEKEHSRQKALRTAANSALRAEWQLRGF